jgi:hypothetical protein
MVRTICLLAAAFSLLVPVQASAGVALVAVTGATVSAIAKKVTTKGSNKKSPRKARASKK